LNEEEIPPPPEPPDLPAEKIRALIEYAERMAASMEAENELIRRAGSQQRAT
jgi:hypothetical protein